MDFKRNNEETEDLIRIITRYIVNIVVIIVFAMFIVQYMCMNYEVTGHSMEPNFIQSDMVLVNRISYKIKKPKRFDVVVFYGNGEKQLYMKRIVGLPGEKIQIQNGKIYVNDNIISENYEYDYINLPGIAEKPVILEKNEYFVIGDNADSSEDSRFSNIGNIKKSDIKGKVWFRFKPLKRTGFVK